jgi:aromatic ring-opening dioxygenase LigB subunit
VLVGGAILPHPPIILPAFADRRGHEVQATIAAVRDACHWVAGSLRPDRLVISTPHRGHGVDVPMSFLVAAMGWRAPVDEVLTDDPSYVRYAELGAELRRQEGSTGDRVAVIASGDCSHRLSPSGPYPPHPRAPELDAAIVLAICSGGADALLAIDPALIEAGGECGLRSFVFALSALEPVDCEVLSYQAPYGVGYLVATLETTPPAPG